MLLTSSSDDPSNKKLAIFEKEMERKRRKFLKRDEYMDEKYQNSEEVIEDHYPEFVIRRIREENKETKRLNDELIEKHNQNIRDREGWDVKGNAETSTINRRPVRDAKFLDDESETGTINDKKYFGQLGDLVVKNRSEKSFDTSSEVTTTGNPEGKSSSSKANYDIKDFFDFFDF